MNFSAVKDLFNWTEGLRRSVKVLVGSDRGLVVDLAVVSKKYLIRCQISSSKIIFVRFHKKNFSAVKDLFNWIEGLLRSVTVLVGSDRGLIVDLAGLSKNFFIHCQISSSKIIFVRFHKKNFSAVKDLFNWIEGLLRSVTVLVGSDRGLIVDLAVLSKKYLIRCQISSSKIIFVRFHKKWISVQSRTCSIELRVYLGVSQS